MKKTKKMSSFSIEHNERKKIIEEINANFAKNLIAYGLPQYDDVNRQDTLDFIEKYLSILKRIERLQFSTNGTRMKTYSLFFKTPKILDNVDTTTPKNIANSPDFEVRPSPLLNLLKDLKATVLWTPDSLTTGVLDEVKNTVKSHKGFLRSKIVRLHSIEGIARTMLCIYFRRSPNTESTPVQRDSTSTVRDYFLSIMSDDPNKLPNVASDWSLQMTVGTENRKRLLSLYVPADWKKSEIRLIDSDDPKKSEHLLFVSSITETSFRTYGNFHIVSAIAPDSSDKLHNFCFDDRKSACRFSALITTVTGHASF